MHDARSNYDCSKLDPNLESNIDSDSMDPAGHIILE